MASETKNLSKLYRSEKNKVLGGVCGGLGEYVGIDPTIIRIIFVLLALFGGGGVLIYFILWVVMPPKSKLGKKSETYIKENVEELKTRTKEVAGNDRKAFLGVILIVVGFSILAENLGFHTFSFVWKLWPLVIVALGLAVLTKKE